MHKDPEFMRVLFQSIDRGAQAASLAYFADELARIQGLMAGGKLSLHDTAWMLGQVAEALQDAGLRVGEWADPTPDIGGL